jgi:uncharacterized membrane protein YeiB
LSTTSGIAAGRPRRLIGLDLASALAIFGMVIVNFKIAMGAETAGPDWLVWLVGLLDGRAAATFVILAGVGIALMTKSARQRGDAAALATRRRSLSKRAAFLFCFGLLYTPIWPADILHFYGLYILIGAWLLTARDHTLWLAALILTAAFMVLLLVGDYEKGWEWTTLHYTDFWTAAGMVRHLFFNGFHPVLPWAAFLLVGIWLGRRNMGDARVRRKLLGGGLAATALAELASHLLTAWMLARFPEVDPTEIRDLFGTAPMPPTPLYLLSAGGTAVVLISLCLSLSQRYAGATWLLSPLVCTGQLALTLYVAHVVVGMGVLEALGFLEGQTLPVAVASALGFCAAGVAFAALWCRVAQRGPLEWAMRRLTV